MSPPDLPSSVFEGQLPSYRRILSLVPLSPPIFAAFFNPQSGHPLIYSVVALAHTEVRSPENPDNEVLRGDVITGVFYSDFRMQLVDDPEGLIFYRYQRPDESVDNLRLSATDHWEESQVT
jgi:hypothetical protein